MIETINHTSAKHDYDSRRPQRVEYLFVQDKSIIDRKRWEDGHRRFQNGFAVNVPPRYKCGDDRRDEDVETISTAVTAAETDTLFFLLLHTNNAAQTVDRIIDSFLPTSKTR